MIGFAISHYRIVEKLGEGGMGAVYKAEDTKLERTVALKFLASHLLNDEEAKARFLREAKAAAGVDHPNICHVHEVGEEGEKTFIAMAFLEGQVLDVPEAQTETVIQPHGVGDELAGITIASVEIPRRLHPKTMPRRRDCSSP